MQFHRILSSLVVAATVVGTPVIASADPAPTTEQATPTSAPKHSATDLSRYAQLEQQSPAAAKFEGGGDSIYIGGSVATIVIVLLLIIILL